MFLRFTVIHKNIKMKKITLLFLLALTSIIAQAQSFSVIYTFDSVNTASGTTDPSLVPIATGVTFGSFTSIGNSTNSGAATRFDFNHFAGGSISGDTSLVQMTGVVADTQYYQVTLSPATNFTMSIDTIAFRFARSGTGVRSYAVRASSDGFIANLPAAIIPLNPNLSVQSGNQFFLNTDITTLGLNGSTVLLGGVSFTNSTTPITFRFYGWNAEGPVGTFSIDNVRFSGAAFMGVGINKYVSQKISVYPNPSEDGNFVIDLGNATSKSVVTVYDIIGNIILVKEINSSGKQTLDLSNQANGSYLVSIKNNLSPITKKVVINK